MNVLQVNSVFGQGSTGRIVKDLHDILLLRGFESSVAYGREDASNVCDAIRIGHRYDNYSHVAKTRIFDAHGYGSYFATKKFVKKIDYLRPSVIHLHNVHGYYLNIEILFNYLAVSQIPVVWTMHDCWPMTGHCAHFDFVCCQKWKTICCDCPQKKSYPTSLLVDRSKKNYQVKKNLFTSLKNLHVVAVSKWLGGIVKQSYLAKYPLYIIPNGIDVDIFFPQKNSFEIRCKYGVGSRYMLMGVATAWSERKGLKDFIELSKVLDDECVIFLVGLSESQLKSLPKKIIGIPRTDDIKELAQLYSAADIILNLSAEETFGLTSVEGFACGTPGIVYNCTASPELITPETGCVVNKGDFNGLINSITKIKEMRKESYSKACRERAVKYYNKNDRYMDYLKLYEEIIQP